MNKKLTARLLAGLIGASTLSTPLITPAIAGNTTSLGHGVKCSWVLISSVNGANTYQQICRKGV